MLKGEEVAAEAHIFMRAWTLGFYRANQAERQQSSCAQLAKCEQLRPACRHGSGALQSTYRGFGRNGSMRNAISHGWLQAC